MHKNLRQPPPRQQKLAFSDIDVWQALSSEIREQCRQRIVQLMEAVIQAERNEGSERDERQDPS